MELSVSVRIYFMNKVIVVGHPYSNLKQIEHQLENLGMQKAQASQRDNLSGVEITKILCEQHQGLFSQQLMRLEDFKSLKIEPIWNYLALDLVMANKDQKNWGWADPEILPLLKFWKALDSKFKFVLVYLDPNQIYKSFEGNTLDSEYIDQQLENWFVYHSHLLNFFLENPKTSILVNASDFIGNGPVLKNLATYLDFDLTTSKFDLEPSQDTEGQTTVLNYLFQQIAASKPHIRDLHQKLKNAAKVKDDAPEQYVDFLHLFEAEFSSKRNINKKISELENLLKKTDTEHVGSKVQVDILTAQLECAQLELENLYKDQHSHSNVLEDFEHFKSLVSQEKLNLKEEINRLQTQINLNLKQTDVLEQQFKMKVEDNQHVIAELSMRNKILDNFIDSNIQTSNHAGINDLQQLVKDKDGIVSSLKDSCKKLETENKLLRVQLSECEKELLGLYAKEYGRTVYNGAVKRVKNELPYRLGMLMIQQSKTPKGLIGLPSSLYNEIKNDKGNTHLPPLDEYSDVHEVEAVKKHLSYRLGSELLETQKNPMKVISLPVRLANQMIQFRMTQKSHSKSK